MASSSTCDPLPFMAPLFLLLQSEDLKILFLSFWLDVRSLATLDVAVSSHRLRPRWMMLLECLRCPAMDDWGQSISSLMWLSKRGIRASRLQMKMDTWRVRGCDILQVDTSDLVHLGLKNCSSMTDQCVMDVVHICLQLRSIDLGECKKVTDAGISALGAGCGQLQSINLTECDKVTDAGISALGAGCGKLQSVDLAYCSEMTDAGVSALGAGCGQLQSINLTGCDKVTDAGISALGAGCGQLQRINIHGCHKVTDAGVSAWGHIDFGR